MRKNFKRKEKELADEKEKVEILKKPAHLYTTTRMKCEAIHLQRALYSVRKMCEALQIRQCQYDQWISRQEKKNRRREQESQLVHQVERAFKGKRKTHPRLADERTT